MAWSSHSLYLSKRKELKPGQFSLRIYQQGHHSPMGYTPGGFSSYLKVLTGRLLVLVIDAKGFVAVDTRPELYTLWNACMHRQSFEKEAYDEYLDQPFRGLLLSPGSSL